MSEGCCDLNVIQQKVKVNTLVPFLPCSLRSAVGQKLLAEPGGVTEGVSLWSAYRGLVSSQDQFSWSDESFFLDEGQNFVLECS